MDLDTTLRNLIQEELLYFYNHIREYDEDRIIVTAIFDDVYMKVLEYDMCDAQKKAVMNTGVALNDMNGTVIVAPEKNKTTLVALSKKVIPQRDLDEVHGTVIHELIHAHDYYDYADFLQISDYNEIFSSEYYNAFSYWTEFHARRMGYKRFIEYKFRKSWKELKKHKCEYLDGIKTNFSIPSNKGRIYDFMQAAGRYYTFVAFSSSNTENFKEDILRGNVEYNLIDILNEIYHFLTENAEFEQFINNIVRFNELLKKIDLMK